MRINTSVIVALMVATASVPCVAQTPQADPFQIPDSTAISCSVMPKEELLKQGNVGFAFAIGSDGETKTPAIKAEFDDSGSPFALVLPVESRDTLSPPQTSVMLFRKDGSVAVMTIGPPQFAPLDSTAKDNRSWLTAEEIVRAKALATWLWARRCTTTQEPPSA